MATPNWPTPTTPAPTTTPPTTPGTPSTADSSAKAIIDGALGQYGLGSLSSWAWQKWQSGESIDQIFLEFRQTPEYKTRFPAMETLSQRGRAISEAQYINYEQSASAILKSVGLPANFYDGPEDFAAFLTNDVGLPELQTRVQAYQTAAFSQPQEVRDELQRLYGVGPGDLTAFFIDPDKALPLIQQKYASAQAGGYSKLTGFGELTAEQAGRIGEMGLTDAGLLSGFGDLAHLNPLLSGLTGSGEDTIGTDVALRAGFGQNAEDQAVIEARKQRRLSEFQGGGGVATTNQGAVGAGSAR